MTHEETIALLEKALEHYKNDEYYQAEKLANDVLSSMPKNKEHEARAFFILGGCCLRTGKTEEAHRHYGTTLTISEAVSNLHFQACALNGIASVFNSRGDYDESLLAAERALSLAEREGDKPSQIVALNRIGTVRYQIAEFQTALIFFNRSLTAAEELGDEQMERSCLQDIGTVHNRLADYPSALTYLLRALSLAEEHSDRRGMLMCLGSIGSVYITLGDYTVALDHLSRALAFAEEIEDKRSLATTLGLIAWLHSSLSDPVRALDYYARALTLSEGMGDKENVAFNLGNIGAVHGDLGNDLLALEYNRRALVLSEAIGHRRSMGHSMYNIAEFELKKSNFDAAYQGFTDTLHLRRDVLKTNEGVAATLLKLGEVLIELGKTEEGLIRLEEALALAEEIGEKQTASEAHKELATAYSKMGDIAKENEHLKKHYALKDEIFSEESRKSVEKFNMRVAIADMESQKEVQRLKAEQAEQALRLKERDLANTASSLAAQTELLGNFRTDLRKIVLRPDRYEPEDIIKQVRAKLKELPCEMIDFSKFEGQFATVHPEFRAKLETTYPELTPQEVKMCMLLNVSLKTPAIARLMCLSNRSVEGHRLNIRKKFELKKEESLTAFLQGIK